MTENIYYWDEKTNAFTVGPDPDPKKKPIEAPAVITGWSKPQRHPGNGKLINNTRDWDLANKECGTRNLAHGETIKSRKKDDAKEDINQAMERAISAIKVGNHQLTEEQRAQCRESEKVLDPRLVAKADALVGRKPRRK